MSNSETTGPLSHSPRCRPGDLAIVVSATYRQNLGLIVTIIRADTGDSFLQFSTNAGPVWICECSMPMKWTWKKKLFRRKCGPVPDSQLQPLRGFPVPDKNSGAATLRQTELEAQFN